MRCSCCCYFTPHCTGTPGRHGRYPRTTKLEQVCRRPRGRSECRRVTPRTGLQPGAGTLERTVPRVCVGSATGAETAPRITREWRWNGPVTARSADAKWKIEKSRFSRLNTAPSPDLCSPACPPHAPTSLGREGGTGWARGSKKIPAPQCFRAWVFGRELREWRPRGHRGASDAARGQAGTRAAKLGQPDACPITHQNH